MLLVESIEQVNIGVQEFRIIFCRKKVYRLIIIIAMTRRYFTR
jgi:hypothetical protein